MFINAISYIYNESPHYHFSDIFADREFSAVCYLFSVSIQVYFLSAVGFPSFYELWLSSCDLDL